MAMNLCCRLKEYCDGCIYADLELTHDALYCGNLPVPSTYYVRCSNAEFCARLWKRLLDWKENHMNVYKEEEHGSSDQKL